MITLTLVILTCPSLTGWAPSSLHLSNACGEEIVQLIHSPQKAQDTYAIERDDGEVEEGVGRANIVTM
jgi:hypothetical protein